MDAKALAQLVKVSHAVGGRPDCVQAGGGNTSIKSADGKIMAIKASGTTLAGLSESAGWVELDLGSVLSMFDLPELERLDSAGREAKVLALLKAAVLGGPSERPSVESALHAMLGKVIIHTHPTAVNALTCGPGESAIAELTRPGELPPLWIPYVDPGCSLAVAVRAAIGTYKKKSAETPKECIALHDDWVRRCESYFAKTAPPLRSARPLGSAALRKLMASVRRAWHDKSAGPVFVRLSADPELTNAALDGDVAGLMAAGAMTPDQIAYTGPYSLFAETAGELEGSGGVARRPRPPARRAREERRRAPYL